MKLKTLFTILATTLGIVATTLTALVLFSLPPTTAIVPFLEEREVPRMELPNVDLGLSNFSDLGMTLNDYETLPDNHVFIVGQTLSGYGVYWPTIGKFNFNAGASWTSGVSLNPNDGTEYLPNGTDVNEFTDVLYVSDSEIYLLGTVRGQLETTTGSFVQIGGTFAGQNVPVGPDIYTFLVKTSSTLSSFEFLGFLGDVSEEGTQETFVTSATMSASNRLLLTGMTTAHSGIFENLSEDSLYQFAIELDTTTSIQLLHAKAFDDDFLVYPYRIQALDNGDVLIAGYYSDAIPSIDLPEPEIEFGASTLLRLEGASWDVMWAISSDTRRIEGVLGVVYNRVIELTDHSLIATAAAVEAESTRLMILYLESDGTLIDLRLVQPTVNFSPETFFKGESGYFVLGYTVGEGQDSTNIQLVQLDDWFNFKARKTLSGSGEEVLYGDPEVTYDERLMMFLVPTVLDGDFAFASAFGVAQPLVAVYLTSQL